MPRDVLRKACAPLKWSCRQARGFGRGVYRLIGNRDDVLPEPALQTWEKLKTAVPEAFGIRGTPQDQVTSSVLLAGVSVASSVVTAGATLVLVAVFALTALIGLARMVPAIGARFTSGRDTAKNGGGRSWRGRR